MIVDVGRKRCETDKHGIACRHTILVDILRSILQRLMMTSSLPLVLVTVTVA